MEAVGQFFAEIFRWIMQLILDLITRLMAGVKKFMEKNQVEEKMYKELDTIKGKRQERKEIKLKDLTNISKLGQRIDGWGELIEFMGDIAEEVSEETLKNLGLKGMPEVTVYKNTAHEGKFKENRVHIFTKTHPDVRTSIYIGKHGTDLYVTWKSWLGSIYNWVLFIALAVIAVGLGYWTFGTQETQGNWYGTSVTEIWALGWILSTLVILFIEAFLVRQFGSFMRGDPNYYFYIQPNEFDADDVAAMNFSVHYSLIRALDSAGIDTTKLRIKEKFSGGRRGEDI